jgi:biopolymer transport protein ExbD
MPKLSMPRKSTHIDMTAMCDVAFLLLTFFMLATKFKPDEPVIVKTPSSISEIMIPDKDVMLLTIDPKGRVFFSIDNQVKRKELIDRINDEKHLNLTEEEKEKFKKGASIGIPFNQLKAYLAAENEEQKKFDAVAPGVPTDTTAASDLNELGIWVSDARQTNPKLRICIKADAEASYPNIHKVINTLEGWHVYRFNLITGLKGIPVGTAAYAMQQSGKSK